MKKDWDPNECSYCTSMENEFDCPLHDYNKKMELN